MQCQNCGTENKHLVFEPVMRKSVPLPTNETDILAAEPIYKRWPCRDCGRYHWPDGTLYSYPFDDDPDDWK